MRPAPERSERARDLHKRRPAHRLPKVDVASSNLVSRSTTLLGAHVKPVKVDDFRGYWGQWYENSLPH
jgi:hypothetical protein